jgi:hypothetical protein
MKNYFPELVDAKQGSLKFKNFLNESEGFDKASLLKIELKRYSETQNWTFREANIKNNDTGDTVRFCPGDDPIIWSEADGLNRAHQGVKHFLNGDCSGEFTSYNHSQLAGPIMMSLMKIMCGLAKFDGKNPELDAEGRQLSLESLSVVIILNHEDKKSGLKFVRPKMGYGEGRWDGIVKSLGAFTEDLMKIVDGK